MKTQLPSGSVEPPSPLPEKKLPAPLICMHVIGSVAGDERVLREASALQLAGYAVTIIDVASRGQGPAHETLRGCRVRHILLPADFAQTRFKKRALLRAASIFLRSTCRLLITPADVYHAHDVTALPACYLAAVLHGKPLIFDAHELPLPELPVQVPWLRTRFHALLEKMIQRCASIITVSAPIAREIRQRYHVSQVGLVRNMLAYRPYVSSDRLRQYLGLAAHTRIALYQGNIQADRDPALLVHVAKLLDPHNVIVLMGKGIGSAVSELEALIAQEGVGERIKVIPPVPYHELLSWTASADVGLIVYSPDHSLNVRMCLPNKLFEYLMAGLPVLATSLEAVADMLNTYHVGRVVDSLEPGEIAAALNQLLANDALLTSMRINALNAVREELCWERERQHLVYLYHEVVEIVSQ
ncbi:MAG TPA: glycosyltransferase family 4 protein [Ktedonobacteraceae bacterium]|nr:glycosyltransferase family 4 protein [Ktedonobacteraceae bacterium]